MTGTSEGKFVLGLAMILFDAANIFRRRESFFACVKASKKSLGRRDRFREKIVKIGAILAIFRPFEVSLLDSMGLTDSMD